MEYGTGMHADSQQCCKMHHKLAFKKCLLSVLQIITIRFKKLSTIVSIRSHCALLIFCLTRVDLFLPVKGTCYFETFVASFLHLFAKCSLTICADSISALIFWCTEYLSHGMLFVLNIITINKYKDTS